MLKIFLVDPFNQKNLLKDELFNSPFGHLYSGLQELGVTLTTYDQKSLECADKVIFFNHNKKLIALCEKLNIGKEKRELVLWEPETVIPDQYKTSVWNKYGKIICFREDLEKKFHFPKVNWPQGQKVRAEVPPFNERKMITLINANKYSYVKGELYSLRRDVIRFFEKKNDANFDLYGRDWERNIFYNPKILAHYGLMALKTGAVLTYFKDVITSCFVSWPSYKGEIPDKYKILDQYKFTICIENEATYITEKIFDSLSSGSIPIYKGPVEIKNLVPKDCYIDFNQFSTLDEMYDFLLAMTGEEFTRRQSKIIEYMNSEQFKQMQPKAVFYKLSEILTQ